ncbi:MAG: helix-turn-helix transcriptional regulator [Anaerolinea sp.]|nr:helix-turn-helix transcriptional regulator [Anaerolinea sp.]
MRQFIREIEVERRRDVTWAEICEGTGIAATTLNRLLSESSQRPDLDVLARICHYFNVPAGPIPFLIYEPDKAGGETADVERGD